MKKLSITIGLLCAACALFAQTFDKPKPVKLDTVFSWEDPNVPPASSYTVYATFDGKTVTFPTQSTSVVLSNLFGVTPQPGTYSLTVLGWDASGSASDATTNYFVELPKKLKAMINLRAHKD